MTTTTTITRTIRVAIGTAAVLALMSQAAQAKPIVEYPQGVPVHESPSTLVRKGTYMPVIPANKVAGLHATDLNNPRVGSQFPFHQLQPKFASRCERRVGHERHQLGRRVGRPRHPGRLRVDLRSRHDRWTPAHPALSLNPRHPHRPRRAGSATRARPASLILRVLGGRGLGDLLDAHQALIPCCSEFAE